MLRLILAFLFLASSFVSADTTYKYFKETTSSQCSLNISGSCDLRKAYDLKGYASGTTISITACRESPTPQYTTAVKIPTSDPNVFINTTGGASYVATTYTKTCKDGEQFVLKDCTATCVPDPCAALKGQEFIANTVCGSWSCKSGGVISGGNCTKNDLVVDTGSPAQNTVDKVSQCVGVFDRPNLTTKFYDQGKDEGKASGTAYCSAFYKNSGVSINDTNLVDNLNLANIASSGAIPLPADGICPDDKPLKSNIGGLDVCVDNKLPDDNPCPVEGEKPNSNGVCVAPTDPTYPDNKDPTKPDPKTSCLKGEIRNNAGKCVPYAQAGTCPAGMHYDSTGTTCINDALSNSCPQGQVKNSFTGACVNDPKGTGCSDGSLPNAQGICANGSAACPSGYKRDSGGFCVPSSTPDPTKTGCNDGSTPNAQGICANGSAACPSGKVRASNGACVADTTNSNTTGTASGSCDTPPACGGDPLQCASLEQIWRSGCEQTKAMSEISQADADKMSGAATASQAKYDTAQQAIDTQAGGFFSDFQSKATAVGAGGQCIANASLSVMGKSLILPFSQACDFFKFLRILLIFSAYMLSARILFNGVT